MPTLKKTTRTTESILISISRSAARLAAFYRINGPTNIIESEKRLMKRFIDELPASPPEVIAQEDAIEAQLKIDQESLVKRAVELFIALGNENWDEADADVQQLFYAKAIDEFLEVDH